MPCKDIKFCDKIKLFWIYERFETYEEIWKRRNFHSTTTEDGIKVIVTANSDQKDFRTDGPEIFFLMFFHFFLDDQILLW